MHTQFQVLVAFVFFALSSFVIADEQHITVDTTDISVAPSNDFSLNVRYTTDPLTEELTGLGLGLHFDSTQLEFLGFESVSATDLVQQDTTPQNDTDNRDQQTETNQRLLTAWLSLTGKWPGQGTLPLLLYRANFRATADFNDMTSIRFSSNTAIGWTANLPVIIVTQGPEGCLCDGDLAPLGARDGSISVADALIALRYALGLIGNIPTDDLAHGDVAPLGSDNLPAPDGSISVADALVILRKALGLITF